MNLLPQNLGLNECYPQEEASRYLANEPKSVGEAISWEMSERDKLHDAYHAIMIQSKLGKDNQLNPPLPSTI